LQPTPERRRARVRARQRIVAGNLMAIPQRNVKRMLAYSGIAHIGYMLMGLAAMSATGAGMVLFYLVAYLFGNMGAFLVVQAVGTSEGSDRMDAYRGLDSDRAQPRAARDDLRDLGLCFARLVGCSALVAGAVEPFLAIPGRRAGTPLSMPSALRSSSTSGQ
jgi:formate hydrogenlyase subunit 3/multisubunit Na+/H+ antiporter MnhD subunit